MPVGAVHTAPVLSHSADPRKDRPASLTVSATNRCPEPDACIDPPPPPTLHSLYARRNLPPLPLYILLPALLSVSWLCRRVVPDVRAVRVAYLAPCTHQRSLARHARGPHRVVPIRRGKLRGLSGPRLHAAPSRCADRACAGSHSTRSTQTRYSASCPPGVSSRRKATFAHSQCPTIRYTPDSGLRMPACFAMTLDYNRAAQAKCTCIEALKEPRRTCTAHRAGQSAWTGPGNDEGYSRFSRQGLTAGRKV